MSALFVWTSGFKPSYCRYEQNEMLFRNSNDNVAVYFAVHRVLSLWVKFLGVTIQVTATEQYLPMVLFAMLNKGV